MRPSGDGTARLDLENADANVGRLLDSIEEMGELDNTLVIYIFGDNGASLEGTVTPSFNEMTMANGIPLTSEQQLSLIGQYGGLGSHLGGTRDGMVVSWPQRIRERGGLRSQFAHCIDIGPTVLEAAGIPEAKVVDGIEQEPMHGTSFVYTFDDAGAAERHTVQYWETFGNRAIYKDGWWACAKLDRIPWDGTPATIARFAPGVYDPEQDTWELYYLPDDFSQAHDLALEQPEKLAELKELFWQEAERNNVLPLLSGLCIFFGILPPMPTITRTTLYGDVENIASGMIPRVYGRSYALESELVIPEAGAEGVIVAEADEMGGFSLWVDADRILHHSYSFMAVDQYRQSSSEPLPTGEVSVRMQFDADATKPGTGGDVTLWANGKQIGGGRMDRSVAMRFSFYAGLDVGRDNGMTVDPAYRDRAPYAFTGTVKKVVFDLTPAPHEEEKGLHADAHRTTAAAALGG